MSVMPYEISEAQITALLRLLRAAQEWREQMVRSNTPAAGYLEDDPDGRAHWARTKNCNGRLVRATDEATDLLSKR